MNINEREEVILRALINSLIRLKSGAGNANVMEWMEVETSRQAHMALWGTELEWSGRDRLYADLLLDEMLILQFGAEGSWIDWPGMFEGMGEGEWEAAIDVADEFLEYGMIAVLEKLKPKQWGIFLQRMVEWTNERQAQTMCTAAYESINAICTAAKALLSDKSFSTGVYGMSYGLMKESIDEAIGIAIKGDKK